MVELPPLLHTGGSMYLNAAVHIIDASNATVGKHRDGECLLDGSNVVPVCSLQPLFVQLLLGGGGWQAWLAHGTCIKSTARYPHIRTFVRPCTVSIWQPAFSSAVHSDRVSSSFGSTRILHLLVSVLV